MLYQLLPMVSMLMYLPLIAQCILIYFTGAVIANFSVWLEKNNKTVYTEMSKSIVFNSSFHVDPSGVMYKTGLMMYRDKNMIGIGYISITNGSADMYGNKTMSMVNGTMLHWGRSLTKTIDMSDITINITRKSGGAVRAYRYNFDRVVTPKPWQKELGAIIVHGIDHPARMDGSKTHVTLLCGKPGIGKTSMGSYVAQIAQYTHVTIICRSTFEAIGEEGTRARTVIVVDEVDEILDEMSKKDDSKEKDYWQKNIDKSEWNTQLDSIRYSSNISVIMTTNLPYEKIHEKLSRGGNESCIREGRIDLFASIIDDKVVVHDPIASSSMAQETL